uniref:Mannosyltransferase n=1 Tax=Cyprinus carpio TaxID=7962 RepID=A0A8C1GET3_CYPCA
MEKIRERFKQKSSCESVRLRKRSSMLYSTDHKHSLFIKCIYALILIIKMNKCVFLKFLSLLISIILFSDGCLFLQVFVPRVFQALLAAYADVKLYNLVLRWESPDVARWTLCCFLSVFLSAVFKLKLITQRCFPIAVKLIVFSIITLTLSVFLKWILVQWNFLKFNVLHNVAVFYGAHPWHWYFTQGLPVVLGRHLPLFLHGCSLATKKHRILVITVLWTTAIYILLAHKEFRFVYPVLPFCMIFSGMSLAKLQAWRKPAAAALQSDSSMKQTCSSPTLFTGSECPSHLSPRYLHIYCLQLHHITKCLHSLQNNNTCALTFRGLIKHRVCFVLFQEISSFLEENRFAKKAEIFHTHFPEGRVGRNILIYTRGSELKTK